MHGLWAMLTLLLVSLSGFTVANAANFSGGPVTMPAGIVDRLTAGQPQDLIVEFDDTAIEKNVAALRAKSGQGPDGGAMLALRTAGYGRLKQQVLAALPTGEFETLIDYDHLPMAFLRVHSLRALEILSRHGLVRAVYPNGTKFPIAGENLTLINQPAVAAAGKIGTGTTAVVIDSGVDYTRSAFGSCTAPGVPVGCKVNYYKNIADSSTALDSNGHGTNVSGIVMAVAPDTRIAMINVFGATSSTSDALIIQAIDWAISNQSTYHISAINLSLGDGTKNTSPCITSNPFVTPVNNAKAAGIITVAASGNDGYTNALTNPACTPNVVSVGAVYDANVGGLAYANCTDATTAADQITCFSDSANFLSLLAPGALITAAGYTMAGTSQAAPHVTGAVAVLRAAFPAETLSETIARMTGGGVPLTDPRNGITTPRLNLWAAVLPAHDGDLNGDGVVDAADVAIAERMALGLVTPTAIQLIHGDVAPAGGNGVIDAADVARIGRKALGLENF